MDKLIGFSAFLVVLAIIGTLAGLSVWIVGWWVAQDRDWVMETTASRLGFAVGTLIVTVCYMNIATTIFDSDE